jgi:hypothetical protein
MMYIKGFLISAVPLKGLYYSYVVSNYNTANMLVKAIMPKLVQFIGLVEVAIYRVSHSLPNPAFL